jgi:hypothetical protein
MTKSVANSLNGYVGAKLGSNTQLTRPDGM